VDATQESGRRGRLLNHSRTNPNVKPRVVEVGGVPHLCLMASRDINTGEALEYDYGERSQLAIDSHPWLAV